MLNHFNMTRNYMDQNVGLYCKTKWIVNTQFLHLHWSVQIKSTPWQDQHMYHSMRREYWTCSGIKFYNTNASQQSWCSLFYNNWVNNVLTSSWYTLIQSCLDFFTADLKLILLRTCSSMWGPSTVGMQSTYSWYLHPIQQPYSLTTLLASIH